jgi:hypothetical protein
MSPLPIAARFPQRTDVGGDARSMPADETFLIQRFTRIHRRML